jgi:DHA1 family inner membrane transport protein
MRWASCSARRCSRCWPPTGRGALLIALMALFAVGNLASALAPGYLSLNLLRFIAGLPHGTYFGVAALVAASLAPPSAGPVRWAS